MGQTKFYFYNLFVQNKLGNQFNWKESLDLIYNETQKKDIVYRSHTDYTLSIHIVKREELQNELLYLGYLVVGEDVENYKKEKKGEFLELEFDDDEHLLNVPKGKLFFLISLNTNGNIILMLEKQYFSLNIKGFLHYLKERHSSILEDIRSKNILGKDLKTILTTLKNNHLTMVRLYFKKYAPQDRIKKGYYVEDVIPKLLEKGIYADITMHWKEPPKTMDFFTKFLGTSTFEEALDIDFGEFLKVFSFETDNDAIPQMNLLDKIVFFLLPFDKSEYPSENEIFDAMKQGFDSKRDKLI